jgi:lipoyl(octanoyl) transferase
MILWCDGAHEPAENMRRDAALLQGMETGSDVTPVLRLFQFDPPGITLGHAQCAERELDLARCARDGVTWAIRPTGGRAIFHADEWTYSFCTRIADAEWGGSLSEAYERLSTLLLDSFARLGVPAERAAPEGARTRRPERRAAGVAAPAPPCFASTTRHEIVRGGRKIVGSAQRRTATTLLQQGSVLLSERHLRIAEYVAVAESERVRVRAELSAASTHIGDIVGRHAPLETWADALSAATRITRRLAGADAFPLTV